MCKNGIDCKEIDIGDALIIAEDILCNDIKEGIFKTTIFIKDKTKRDLYEGLAKVVDWSTALNSLIKEVNDVYQAQSDSE